MTLGGETGLHRRNAGHTARGLISDAPVARRYGRPTTMQAALATFLSRHHAKRMTVIIATHGTPLTGLSVPLIIFDILNIQGGQ